MKNKIVLICINRHTGKIKVIDVTHSSIDSVEKLANNYSKLCDVTVKRYTEIEG